MRPGRNAKRIRQQKAMSRLNTSIESHLAHLSPKSWWASEEGMKSLTRQRQEYSILATKLGISV